MLLDITTTTTNKKKINSGWWFQLKPSEKYARQIGKSSPRIGVKIKNNWNHHLDLKKNTILFYLSGGFKRGSTTDSHHPPFRTDLTSLISTLGIPSSFFQVATCSCSRARRWSCWSSFDSTPPNISWTYTYLTHSYIVNFTWNLISHMRHVCNIYLDTLIP